jgi:hypothetical protein
MQNSKALTLKAFLAALTQQKSPLETSVQEDLRQIALSLPTSIPVLNALATNVLSLTGPYKEAYNWLSTTNGEGRRKTGVSEDISSYLFHLESLQDILFILERTDNEKMLIDSTHIFTASDPVKAARSFIISLHNFSDVSRRDKQEALAKLRQTMDELSAEAQARGLTPEILESILNDG